MLAQSNSILKERGLNLKHLYGVMDLEHWLTLFLFKSRENGAGDTMPCLEVSKMKAHLAPFAIIDGIPGSRILHGTSRI